MTCRVCGRDLPQPVGRRGRNRVTCPGTCRTQHVNACARERRLRHPYRCRGCGDPIPRPGTGRYQFCAACRFAWVTCACGRPKRKEATICGVCRRNHLPRPIAHCKRCGEAFAPKRNVNATFCSRSCYQQYRREHPAPFASALPSTGRRGQGAPRAQQGYTIPCAWALHCHVCGHTFTTTMRSAKYCSWACLRRFKQWRRFGWVTLTTRPEVLQALYLRGQAMHVLRGEPVDPPIPGVGE